MISTEDIRDKEVINIYDGKSLGFVYDIEINLERGTVEGIIIPARRRLFRLGGGQDDQLIRWKDIRRIGADVVLVDLPNLRDGEFTYDRDQVMGTYETDAFMRFPQPQVQPRDRVRESGTFPEGGAAAAPRAEDLGGEEAVHQGPAINLKNEK